MKYYDIDKFNEYSSMLEKHYTEKYVDTDLALHIYDFLNENCNTLPSYSTFNNIIDSINIGDKISEGYGVTIYLSKKDNSTNPEIVIEMEINVDNEKKRLDKITSDNHCGVFIYKKRAIFIDEL